MNSLLCYFWFQEMIKIYENYEYEDYDEGLELFVTKNLTDDI